MANLRRIFRTDLSCSVPFDETKGFSWHFAAFQGLTLADVTRLDQSYIRDPIRSLQYLTTDLLPSSFEHFKKILHKHVISYSERSVWQGTDEKGNEIIVFIEVLGDENTPLSRRCKEFTRLMSQDDGVNHFYVLFDKHWFTEGFDNEENVWKGYGAEKKTAEGEKSLGHIAASLWWIRRSNVRRSKSKLQGI
ncbi:hypothetical protein BKA61DRAFT_674652 [Leptodontidium sp. MPI-SDFR-AT-0119]|nr:hypothetical protein BKA61DRAFT_674652 [Leptodontidium sp. MPI-SDFR-AT-0119]